MTASKSRDETSRSLSKSSPTQTLRADASTSDRRHSDTESEIADAYLGALDDRSLHRYALDASPDAICIAAIAGQQVDIRYANVAFRRLLSEWSADYPNGGPTSMLAECTRRMRTEIAESRSPRPHFAVEYVGADNGLRRLEVWMQRIAAHGDAEYFAFALRDASGERAEFDRLLFAASHDGLTGLANRDLLMDRLARAIAAYERDGEAFMVAFLDLNGFKQFNDEFGHSTGDAILRHASSCIAAHMRHCDTAARFGGDEFVILVPGLSGAESADRFLSRIVAALEEPLADIGCAKVTCCTGVAFCPRDGTEALRLLSEADRAMYRAKRIAAGRSCLQGLRIRE